MSFLISRLVPRVLDLGRKIIAKRPRMDSRRSELERQRKVLQAWNQQKGRRR